MTWWIKTRSGWLNSAVVVALLIGAAVVGPAVIWIRSPFGAAWPLTLQSLAIAVAGVPLAVLLAPRWTLEPHTTRPLGLVRMAIFVMAIALASLASAVAGTGWVGFRSALWVFGLATGLGLFSGRWAACVGPFALMWGAVESEWIPEALRVVGNVTQRGGWVPATIMGLAGGAATVVDSALHWGRLRQSD